MSSLAHIQAFVRLIAAMTSEGSKDFWGAQQCEKLRDLSLSSNSWRP
ncbi:MAG: hypothetical protein ACLPVO_19655 [Desulfomonilaceae bacterium]